MTKQASRWIVAVILLASSPLAAEPLSDLRTRLAAMRNDQPARIKVEVELRHKGTAPLHWNGTKKRGTAVVVYGPEGVKRIDQRWSGSSSRLSVWGNNKVETEMPL